MDAIAKWTYKRDERGNQIKAISCQLAWKRVDYKVTYQ